MSENYTQAQMADLRLLYTESQDALTADNWPTLFSDFVASVPNSIEESAYQCLAKGWTGQLLEAAYLVTRTAGGNASHFGRMLKSVLAGIALPPCLSEDGASPVDKKRLPPLQESAAATIERLQIIERLPNEFNPEVAMILAGSMRYGPFFNVRKYKNGPGTFCSDIDILAIMPDFTGAYKETLLESSLFATRSVASFLKRSERFAELYEHGQAEVLAHRFDIRQRDFNVSMHMLPRGIFSSLFSTQLANDLNGGNDVVQQTRSYKHVPFSHETCDRRGFDGSTFSYVVPRQVAIEGGYITTLPAYAVQHGNFYPGFWHDMLLPDCKVYTDGDGKASHIVSSFQELVQKRLAQEQQHSPESSLTRALVRSDVFAPERYDAYGAKHVSLS